MIAAHSLCRELLFLSFQGYWVFAKLILISKICLSVSAWVEVTLAKSNKYFSFAITRFDMIGSKYSKFFEVFKWNKILKARSRENRASFKEKIRIRNPNCKSLGSANGVWQMFIRKKTQMLKQFLIPLTASQRWPIRRTMDLHASSHN